MPNLVSNLEALGKKTLTSVYKGIPLEAEAQRIEEFLRTNPNLFTSGFQFPVAILRKSALDNNLKRMAEYCREVGASLAPHVKTTMSPQIAQMQMEHGAWALTVANYSQARVFLDLGFERIIIANEIVDRHSIRAIAQKNLEPGHEVIFYVDSLEGLEIIQDALSGLSDARVHLLLEIGFIGGRGGIRDNDDAQAIAKKVAQDSRLSLRGVSGFEGIVAGADRSSDGMAKVREFCQKIVAAAKLVAPYVGTESIIITAGGSAFFDIVAEEFNKYDGRAHLILRSGGYISHDSGFYERLYPFADQPSVKQLLPAIELWAQVLTQPEPGLAILNLGKRDVGNDVDNPLPFKKYRREISAFAGVIDHLNDQHGYLNYQEEEDVRIADVIGMGISHPCTTFDKWKLMPLVDDNYDVVEFIHTFF